MDEKTCRKCNQTKPLGEFDRRAECPDGHRSTCKLCRKETRAPRTYRPLSEETRKQINARAVINYRKRTGNVEGVDRRVKFVTDEERIAKRRSDSIASTKRYWARNQGKRAQLKSKWAKDHPDQIAKISKRQRDRLDRIYGKENLGAVRSATSYLKKHGTMDGWHYEPRKPR